MRKVNLWGLCGSAIIVPEKTGVYYSNQVGGTACFKKELEGFLIPLNNDCLPQNFEDLLETQFSNFFSNDDKSFDTGQAEKFNALLRNFPETTSIRVDPSKVADSVEAWVYVIIEENAFSLFSGIGKSKGVLTWCNND